METAQYIPGTYNYPLVALTLGIAVLTGFAAIELAGRVSAHTGRRRGAWLAAGSVLLGTGLFLSHCTGMQAVRLPVHIDCLFPTGLWSMALAVLAAAIALFVASGERLKLGTFGIGALLMGAAIATMQSVEMIQLGLFVIRWDNITLWLLSGFPFLAMSFVTLLVMFRYRDGQHGTGNRISVACAIGLPIPIIQHMGMVAVTFIPTTDADLSQAAAISHLAGVFIVVLACLTLQFAVLTSLLDSRLSSQAASLAYQHNILRALIDSVPDLIYVKDTQSRFLIANQPVATEVGAKSTGTKSQRPKAPQDLIGKSDADFYAPEVAAVFYADEQRIVRTGEPILNQLEMTTDAAGNMTYIITTKVPLLDRNGVVTGIAGVGRNITELKRQEAELHEAQKRYQNIFNDAIIGIFQIAPDGRFLNVNPALAALLGYDSPEDMLANVQYSSQLYTVPERRQEYLAMMTEKGEVTNYEVENRRKDGSAVLVSINARAILQDGVVVRHEGMVEDITERRRLRLQILQSQKLESVGQLAAGIAHEINTPIQYVGDNIRFLKDSFRDLTSMGEVLQDALRKAEGNGMPAELVAVLSAAVQAADLGYLLTEIPHAIDQTLEGVARVATLVSAMKEFSHPGQKERLAVDLNRAIQSTVTVARNEWKYFADLNMDLDPTLPSIICHPGGFNQVILNLIVNAAHAVADANKAFDRERGEITVTTRNYPSWVEIRIQDNGGGIPQEIKDRIFDPFFTTKEIGKGTGQGLAIARSVIVDKHGGTLDFESIKGQGTVFIIRLPHEGRAAQSAAA